MKQRIISVLIVIVLTLSLAACGGNANSSQSAPSGAESSQPAPSSAEPSQAAPSSTAPEPTAAYTPEGEFNIRVFAAAGGIADTVTRIAAQGLQEQHGVTAIVNNITGASGAVAAADLDTYDPSINELAVVSMSLFTMAPLMTPDLNVSLDNYEMVGSLIRDEFVLLVSPSSGIENWEDLVEYASSNQIIYASNTPGGNTHIVQTALFGEAGLNAQALTSDGSNKDILAVMSGDAICTSATVTLAKTYVDNGDLIPIAIFSNEPSSAFEGYDAVPTVPSLGYDITIPSYNFIITRAGVDKSEIEGLYNAMLAYRDTDSFKAVAATSNYTPDNTDGETLRSEIAHYAQVCKDIYDKYYA